MFCFFPLINSVLLKILSVWILLLNDRSRPCFRFIFSPLSWKSREHFTTHFLILRFFFEFLLPIGQKCVLWRLIRSFKSNTIMYRFFCLLLLLFCLQRKAFVHGETFSRWHLSARSGKMGNLSRQISDWRALLSFSLSFFLSFFFLLLLLLLLLVCLFFVCFCLFVFWKG